MTSSTPVSSPEARTGEAELEGGTYEVLRSRLAQHAAELARRAEALNARRVEVFGGSELRLIGTERIRTEHNCVPRDIVALPSGGEGGLMLFGYNVFIGLKPETTVDDVFSLHRFVRDGDTFRFDEAPDEMPGLLRDSTFQRHFAELYRYYRETRLLQLRRVEGKLLAIFQTGVRTEDVKVLRWRISTDGTVTYLDNRGERDHVFPAQHDFEWTETTRDDHVLGRHPHISIRGQVFVETVGGNLTIKVEDNSESGEGIYQEPVDEPLQSLADADVHFAEVGPLILLKIRPYNEKIWRYLVFNTRTKDIERLDGIGQACRRLPEDQGLIFPGGYYLETGSARTFDTDTADLEFERVIRSGNGEDVLYVFHARKEGRTLLLPYNVIRKEAANPVPCHGYSLFDDGTLVVFRADSDEPTRVHPMQVWQTPYESDVYAAAQPAGTGPLERIGNADLVRGISDCLSLARMVGEMTPATAVFEAMIAAATRASDHYHWLGSEEAGDLLQPLRDLKETAERVIDEFEKVSALTAQADRAVDESEAEIASLIRISRGSAPRSADGWVTLLADLRKQQGHLITLRDMRYVDTARLEGLDEQLSEALSDSGRRAVEFLSGDDAFDSFHRDISQLIDDADSIDTVASAQPITARLAEQADGLQVVTQIVSSLEIGDAVVRTRILERIGEVLAGVNRARATVESRRKELLTREGRAEFAAEFGLLGQAITGALAVADSPDACDEQLGRLLLQLENLESRFSEFDEFLDELSTKREDVYEAFSSRKQALLDERSRRADRLADSAQRIIASVSRRVAGMNTVDEVNTYFASDPMVAKLRSLAGDLREIGDSVRAEEIEGRIKAARQEAGRSLRDRQDLYADGGETIRLGKHRFAVNTQAMDLTLVPHGADGDTRMAFAITGTDYRADVTDPEFAQTAPYWNQLLVSETNDVYRGEYLAAALLAEAERGGTADELREALVADGELEALVRRAAEARYDEGYERGVHDHDAARILSEVLRLHAGAELLRYSPGARAAAQLFWAYGPDGPGAEQFSAWETRAASLHRARNVFGRTEAVDALADELSAAVTRFSAAHDILVAPGDQELVGEYLFEELAAGSARFVSSNGARTLLDRFHRALGGAAAKSRMDFDEDLRALEGDVSARLQLVRAWLTAFIATRDSAPDESAATEGDLAEAVAIEVTGTRLDRYESSASITGTAEPMLGSHPRIQGRKLTFRLDELLARTGHFRAVRVPGYRAFQRQRNELVVRERKRLRLDEYAPTVMSGFVRNRLLDDAYLPLIGDNLAKQLGATGDGRRTDQSGLLLLISPPGYGKTTLMEYVANRLGVVFVKVNGPALGHHVTSVDPAEAPNATARQEVEKINFALEMGNNVLLYLDDIQHTSPELLQKFISLCDAQRRMEGVWNGRTRTYDMRGKRFAVCMAGNPYTEQGKRFRIPDMLANRADVWNLGDVLSGREDLFALSYIENALTSNQVLAPLAARERSDIDLIVRLARGDSTARPDQLQHPYSAAEMDEVLAVMKKMLRVQQVVLAVNQAYIASAATADANRTEPPFQLQGSYRNMGRLAERIAPVMNDEELEAVIDDHYLGEAQTLTSGAESNLLKLGEIRGRLTPEQQRRWETVKEGFRRAQALGGAEDDPVTRAVGAVGLLADRVGGIESAIRER
ncbi:DNA repair ATPase [Hoyosella sp. YIM 151337]|uniref:DNA repair ATPase n=1 Tax=Hoyosella sp. YIM 151337 TaxID=2992742 RepID=UPI00223635AB|nr:DNA repair ATPase [Hoyosella sp. YIM 151337]MCW4355879.1 DNA repair ATPase [Hoyosella sp. YIM 151337]